MFSLCTARGPLQRTQNSVSGVALILPTVAIIDTEAIALWSSQLGLHLHVLQRTWCPFALYIYCMDQTKEYRLRRLLFNSAGDPTCDADCFSLP